jgi:L-lysine exporter family protein LysE/ArgO
MISALFAGLALGLSLIVAIGAQNVFVLRQGIRRQHVLAVALACIVSDAALIAAGVAGLGVVVQAAPWAIDVARWAGAVFLLGYAALAALRAWHPSGDALRVAGSDGATEARPTGQTAVDGPRGGVGTRTAVRPARTPLAPVLLTCLTLTWLNPHVYLDTVFLLGSVAATQGTDRWWFAAGAIAASTAWFLSLAYGARFLGRWLSTPRAWRILDGAIAVIMALIGVSLILTP